MGRKAKNHKLRWPKTRLGLPDLDQSKAAVIGSLRSPESQRGYRHATNEFIDWYCSEPRLSFNRTVVLRYRMHLESRNLAPGTINVRMAAVRRLAYEAADAGLLSPELAAGTAALRVQKSSVSGLEIGYPRVKHALCGNRPMLKRSKARETVQSLLSCSVAVFDDESWQILHFDHLQRREDHWAIVDLVGKGGHVRTVPVPEWVNGSSMNGSQQPELPTGTCFAACAVREPYGATESRKSCVARRENAREEIADSQTRAARLSSRAPRFCHSAGGELETDSILAGACICTNN
jgi:hypothetical protein